MQWFFARRYLVSRSSHSVINIIASVSLVSVAIPVAAMVILLSVFNGFEGLIKQMYASADADIEISQIDALTAEFRESVISTEGVDAISFVIEGQALAKHAERRTAVAVRGVDSHYFEVLPLEKGQLQGSTDISAAERAVLTRDVAQLLSIYTIAGSNITLHSLRGGNIGSVLPIQNIKSCQLPLAGFINNSQQLKGTVIIPYSAAERLFGRGQTKVYVRCSKDIESVKLALQKALNGSATIRSRDEKNSAFYQIMRYEKWAIFFVALLVLLIASLSIIGTVIMLIVEKRDQQTTLLSMGADWSFIRGIFVREGLLISGIGGISGLIIGIIVVLIQQHFGVITLPADGFLVESYPVKLQIVDIVLVFITFVAIAWAVSQIAANTMIKKR